MSCCMRLPLAALALVTLASTPAFAQVVVHNNFGTGDTFDIFDGLPEYGPSVGLGPISVGFGFTPSISGTLLDITVALSHTSGTNDAHLFLSDGTSSIPGTILETFLLTNLPDAGTSFTPETLISTLHPLLTAGTTYYLYEKETGNEENFWNENIQVERGLIGSNDNVNYSSSPGVGSGAYRVRVNANPVPEPGSVALLATSALTGAGFLVRRRRKARQAA